MTFINLDSRGKVTAEWGVGRRKQGEQQKTQPLTQSLSLSLTISPPAPWQVPRHLVPVPVSLPLIPSMNSVLLRGLCGPHVLSRDPMSSSHTPSPILPPQYTPILPTAMDHGLPSQSIIPDPVVFAADSTPEGQVQGRVTLSK